MIQCYCQAPKVDRVSCKEKLNILLNMETLYEYYSTQGVRPTYANFDGESELAEYEVLRRNVFYRLMLPPTFFAGKRLLEFGPDTGENSLVFAKWGARLTLVEPNVEAHPYIRRYFSEFNLDALLENIVAASLLDFSAPSRFDAIDAEGFIYTIQPSSSWIKKTGECLEPDGFLIISYMELYGGFIELLTKAIYQRTAGSPAYGTGIDTAKRLFLPKWESIQHTRKFDSWFMDVIENPFVRMKYYIDSVKLLEEMHVGGFRLYSSWPNYRNALSMQWIKAPLCHEDEMRASISFVEQGRLSHLLGSNCYFPGLGREFSDALATLISITDGLIDTWSREACALAEETLSIIEGQVQNLHAANGDKNLDVAIRNLAMIRSIFIHMSMDRADRLIEFCRTDTDFLVSWGTPAHYAIFQRTA